AHVVARLFVLLARVAQAYDDLHPSIPRPATSRTRKYGRSDGRPAVADVTPPLSFGARRATVMTADTPPIAAPDAAPKKVYERKTRVPDWFTDLVLVITGAFGVWAVILVAMTFLSLAQPSFYTTDQK